MHFIKGDLLDGLKDIKTPVHCVLSRQHNVYTWVDSVPLHPEGSLWVYVKSVRRLDGSLPADAENLVLNMDKWYLADKICWVPKQEMQTVLRGYKKTRKYTGSCGCWLRFTKAAPKMCWSESPASNVWERTSNEEASWYKPFIEMTCPDYGIVLDPYCCDGFVAEAAMKAGRKFVGISYDVEYAKKYIDTLTLNR